MLIDGQPTDFAPPWKTENAIRQQFSDISALNDAFARLIGVRDQLRADLAAAVAARDWQIQATKAAIESCNQATTAGLAAIAERDTLRAYKAKVEAVEVTQEMCERVAASFYGVATFANGVELFSCGAPNSARRWGWCRARKWRCG